MANEIIHHPEVSWPEVCDAALGYKNGITEEHLSAPVQQKLNNVSSGGGGVPTGGWGMSSIADGAITEAKIADGAITEAKIADGAITGAKLAADAVTVAKLGGGYGVCSSLKATTGKIVTITGFVRTANVPFYVKFNYDVQSGDTLNVRSSSSSSSGTGPCTLRWNGANVPAGLITAGSTVTLVYDGTYYQVLGVAAVDDGFGICSGNGTARAVTITGLSVRTGTRFSVRFDTYAVPAGATLNVNNYGPVAIRHKGAAIADGVIDVGDIATFVYDGEYYQLVDVMRANPSDDSNYFIHLTPSPGGGGAMLADRTASDIYTALSADTDLNFILIDGNGRQAHLTKKPANANDSAQFTLVANGNQITYTLPTNGGNTVTIATESTIGGGGTATWESILPDDGIRQTDIAKLTVTFAQQSNGYTASSNLTQVLAALNDNKAVECKLGDHIGKLVYAHQDAQDPSSSFVIFRMTGMIAAFQNQENEDRFPAILMLYMTHVGVSYKEFAIGGACYCYVTANNGVYDINQANTSLAAQTIPGLLTAFYAGIETQMVVYDGYQRWAYPVISHYQQAEIVFGGLEQAIEDGNVVSYLVSYTFSAQNAHIIRNRRRVSVGMDVPAPESGDNGKALIAGANGTASWQTPSGGGSGLPSGAQNGRVLAWQNGAATWVSLSSLLSAWSPSNPYGGS